MYVFGLDPAHLRSLITPVSGTTELEDGEVAYRFARAAWSVITEPGDGDAGALIARFGAAEALRRVLREAGIDAPGAASGESTDVVSVVDAREGDAGHPGDGLADSDRRTAFQRWKPRLRAGDVERALSLAARAGVRMLVPPGTEGQTSSTTGVSHGAERTASGTERLPVDAGQGTDAGGRLRDPWSAGVADLGVHAPVVLWARGAPHLLEVLSRSVALVGARAASGYGEHVAGELSAGLVERGLAVVSGAAYGIDGMAHRAALASGGVTIAFLAGGVDRFYPAGHDELLRRIVDRGLVLSEPPCGAAPTKWRFLERNRLIAACSSATVVVEAGARSGSLNTAGHAASLGRPLGAVPGPITSPASAGCHRLLREYDAVCVTNAAEAAELVAPQLVPELRDDRDVASRDSAQTVRLLDALTTRTARTPGEVAALSGLGLGAVLAGLGELEIDGRVREAGEGWVAVPRRR